MNPKDIKYIIINHKEVSEEKNNLEYDYIY